MCVFFPWHELALGHLVDTRLPRGQAVEGRGRRLLGQALRPGLVQWRADFAVIADVITESPPAVDPVHASSQVRRVIGRVRGGFAGRKCVVVGLNT